MTCNGIERAQNIAQSVNILGRRYTDRHGPHYSPGSSENIFISLLFGFSWQLLPLLKASFNRSRGALVDPHLALSSSPLSMTDCESWDSRQESSSL